MNCAQVCPKGLNPAKAIAEIKKMLVERVVYDRTLPRLVLRRARDEALSIAAEVGLGPASSPRPLGLQRVTLPSSLLERRTMALSGIGSEAGPGDLNARVVIVGAGHAGGSAAAAFLRQYGHTGPIVLIGDEPLLPYQRPPLSKAWLKGEADADSLQLKPSSWYEEAGVSLRLGGVVVSIDRGAKTVTLASGEHLPYDYLILATGARARALPIPGADLAGVLALRTAADAEMLKEALAPASGWRWWAAAMWAWRRRPRPWPWAATPPSSSASRASWRGWPARPCRSSSRTTTARRGVTFVLNAGVEGFEGRDGHVTGVRLADGSVIACDVALIGVGAVTERGTGPRRRPGVRQRRGGRYRGPHGRPVRVRDRRPDPSAAADL